MNKFKASFFHFLISLAVIAAFITFVYCVWYQQVYFDVSGVAAPLKLLVVVDVVLGPLLTFIIYKEGKKYLNLDLSLIALFQLIALSYGAYNIYLGKPSLIVHRTGYLEVIIEKNIDYSKLSDEMSQHGFWFYPVYGKIDSGELGSDDLTPISNVHDYLDHIVPFDIHTRESYTRPMTLEQTEEAFKNAQEKTKEKFEKINQAADNFMFYELKFEQVYGVLFIDNSNLQFKTVLTP